MHAAHLPALLSNIFVCITFHWNITKLAYLQQVTGTTQDPPSPCRSTVSESGTAQVVLNIDAYPTHVETVIVTDHVAQLHEATSRWLVRHRLQVVGPASSTFAADADESPYRLVWEHRHYAEAAFRKGAFTTYMYLEDDTFILWPSMLSWAYDTEALAPLGFMRGFYRTEVDNRTGQLLLLDVRRKLDIHSWNRTVHLPQGLFLCPAREHTWLPAVHRNAGHQYAGKQLPSNRTCLVHSSFVQLPFPFMGMWIATHEQLRVFMDSDAWQKQAALERPVVSAFEDIRYGYPERSTIFSQLARVPDGFFSASVVPYDSETLQLAAVAAIAHLRNGYVGSSKNYSSIPVKEYML